MFPLQWQNLRKRDQKMPDHVAREAETSMPRTAGRDRVKQDRKAEIEMCLSAFAVPEYNGPCCTWGSHLCLQTGWLVKSEKLLFISSSLRGLHSWKNLNGPLIGYWFSAFPWGLNCCGSELSQSFLGIFSKKSSFYYNCKMSALLEKICWKHSLNRSSLSFTPLSWLPCSSF